MARCGSKVRRLAASGAAQTACILDGASHPDNAWPFFARITPFTTPQACIATTAHLLPLRTCTADRLPPLSALTSAARGRGGMREWRGH